MPPNLIAGRYRLDKLLGHGGMSEVWAATDTELERRVALKLLAPHADTARFEREARAVASLGHPNITQLYDYGEEDGRPFIVLELLSGGTLEDRLRSGGPLPDEDTRRIAAELAAGLAHAHARGVVHRDLKPANVLFDQEGRAKLADFGLARMAAGGGTLTEAGTVLGTAAYISPEQAAGAPASAASDVYSFGVMLYRMLTGRLPFESNSAMELVALHRDSEPPPLNELRPDAPALLEATATAALAKDPADRPPDGAALLAALGVPTGLSSFTTSTDGGLADTAATRVLPVPATPEPRGARARRPRRPLPRRDRGRLRADTACVRLHTLRHDAAHAGHPDNEQHTVDADRFDDGHDPVDRANNDSTADDEPDDDTGDDGSDAAHDDGRTADNHDRTAGNDRGAAYDNRSTGDDRAAHDGRPVNAGA